MAFEEEKRRRKALEEKLDLFKTEVVYCFLFLWIVSLHGKCDFDLEPTIYFEVVERIYSLFRCSVYVFTDVCTFVSLPFVSL